MKRRRVRPRPITAPVSLPSDRLWTQKQAAAFLNVTARYLRDSRCPKLLLPGNGAKGKQLVRYDPAEVRAWVEAWGRDVRLERRVS